MKLSSALVQQTLTQFKAQPIPEDHPSLPKLSRLFGDHTFFLDRNGLNVVEPTATAEPDAMTGRVVKLASWRDGTKTDLVRHEPEPTEVVVALDVAA
jgi:hypothetical protein